MKALYSKTAWALALLLATGLSLKAETVKKDYHKEFPAAGVTQVSVSNQFGEVKILPSDQDKIVIDAVVEVTSGDAEKARKVIDRIEVKIGQDGSKVMAETKLGENGKGFTTGKGDMKSFTINYTVQCPTGIALKLEHQFGDIVIGTWEAPVDVDLQFGALKAVALNGADNKIEFQFGKLSVDRIKSGSIELQHSEAFRIGECGSLKMEAQFSEIELGQVGSLEGEFSSCEVKMESLSGSLKLESNMGSLIVGTVMTGFKTVDIEQQMGSIELGMDPKAGYKLSAEVTMGSVKFPESVKVTKHEKGEVPGVSAQVIEGAAGNGSGSVRVSLNLGDLKIR